MATELLHVTRGGSGPTVVLLHGVAGSGAIWGPVARLLEADYDVIRLDLLGYGHSPKPTGSYTIERHLAAIEATLGSLKLSRPFYLSGLSMGSLLALDFTARHPEEVRKLVCVGLTDYRTEQEAQHYIRHDIWARLAMEHPIIGRISITLCWGIGRRSSLLAKLFGPSFYTPLMIKEAFMNTFNAFQSTIHYCMLLNPALPLLSATNGISRLFIQGSDDAWSDPKQVVSDIAALPNAELKILQNIAHNTVVIAPEQTAQLMHAFLQAS